MDSPPVIGIISPGAMGAAVAKRLSASGCRVLSSLSGRSEWTRQRAQESGMEDASLATIVREAKWLLSIVPPDSAEPLVHEYLQILSEVNSENSARTNSDKPFMPPVFVDCNAKSPETTKRLASIFSSNSPDAIKPFLNACIIGLPPLGDHNPTFYASAEQNSINQRALEEFGTLSRYGMKITILSGKDSDLCDASALKMTFSVYISFNTKRPSFNVYFKGIMKGMVAIYETMILCRSLNCLYLTVYHFY